MDSARPIPELVARVNAEHFIKSPLKPADLLFVFGTRHGVDKCIDLSYELWRTGYCKWLLVSGGMTPGSPLTECEIIKAGLVSRGVPPESIFEEHRATNTGENVIFSLPILDAAIGLKNIQSVICLGKVCTSRRYPMTLQRHWPQSEKMLVVYNHYNAPVENWHTDAKMAERVIREWNKIEPYKAQGFIADGP